MQFVRWLATENGFSRETLKPKSSGYSLRSFFKRVLFPEPEGPATTSGLGRACKEEEEEEDLFASVCLEAMSRRADLQGLVTYILLVEALVILFLTSENFALLFPFEQCCFS